MKQVYEANHSMYLVSKTRYCCSLFSYYIQSANLCGTISSSTFLHFAVNPQYETEELQERGQFLNSDVLDYTFVYLAHPGPVTGISWRKTSKYIPVYVNILYFLPPTSSWVCEILIYYP